MSIGPSSLRSAARKNGRVLAALEALENRQMLSVDLLGSPLVFVPSVASYVIGGQGTAGYGVSNGGNTDYTGGAKVSFYLSSDTTLDNADTLLATKSIPKIRANGIVLKPQVVNIQFPKGVSGTFRILTVVDSEHKIAESDETNNVSTTGPISLDPANYDLSATYGPVTLPPSVITGDPAKGKVSINLTNGGNAPIPAGQVVAIQVKARPTDANDALQDVLIGSLSAKVAKLANGKSKTFKVNVELPANLAAKTYKLITVVDSGNALTETNENNNTADSLASYTLTAAAAFTDLSVELAGTDVNGTAVTGSDTSGAVVLRNNGNIPLKGDVKVEFFAAPLSNLNNKTSLGSQTFSVNLKPGASTKPLKLPLTIAESLSVSNYNFTAVISNFNGFTDSNANNNKHAAGDNISVAKGLGVLGKLNSTITFTRTGGTVTPNVPSLGTVTVEEGSFNDNNGHTGLYSWTSYTGAHVGNVVVFNFHADNPQFENIEFKMTSSSRPTSIDGKTIVFKKPGNSGDGTFLGLVLSLGNKVQKGVFDIL
jgi:CARDB